MVGILLSDLVSMTSGNLIKKYGVSESTIVRRRRENGIKIGRRNKHEVISDTRIIGSIRVDPKPKPTDRNSSLQSNSLKSNLIPRVKTKRELADEEMFARQESVFKAASLV